MNTAATYKYLGVEDHPIQKMDILKMVSAEIKRDLIFRAVGKEQSICYKHAVPILLYWVVRWTHE